MKVSTATRLSISLVALTLSVLLAAQSIGMMPDPADATLKGRAHLCESLALSCSMAAQRGNFDDVRAIAGAIMQRNSEVLSLGLRRADGKLLVDTGGHAGLWKLKPQERSSDAFVQVPIFQGDKQWGTLELCFHPLRAHGFWGFLSHPFLRLLLFTTALAYVAYLLYLRKTLRYLDPSSVIPERVKAMLDTLAEGVLVLDRRERVVLANDAFGSLVGRPAAQLAGLAAATLPWTKTTEAREKAVFPWAQTLRTGVGHRGAQITLFSGAGGAERRLVLSCAPIHADKGATRGVLLTFDDVTEIEATNAQLRETLDMLGRSRDEIERQNKELQALVTTDPLTGCRNRRSFHAEFQSRWGEAQRYGSSLACVMVDVDFFKKINDRYGHSVGDQVLQHVAGILRSMARDSDMVCRYGGEEFCMLLPEADVVAAAQAAERFRAAIETRACGGVSVTVSLGVSSLELGAASPQALLDQADKCLYAAKRGGRNRVVRWDEIRDTPAAEGPAATPAVPASNKASVPISFHAVTALMSALAHRDKGTADHSRRVADLCAAAAVGLLSVKDRFVLEVGALLHDIGKLGVPDAILLKPGALRADEWTIMRSHDRMGVEIISAAFGSAELTEIVRTHHAQYASEAFDPTLPKGRDIPLGARILALADAYDAMVSNRPYRKGCDREKAFAELRRCAGGQFDPDLVEPFIAAVLARDRAAQARRDAHPDGTSSPTDSAASESVRDETALRLRLEVERLAWAAEARDLACLAEVARQVAATAAVDGLGDFADRVRDLERAATEHGADIDYDALTRAVNDLLELCRSPQGLRRIEQGTQAA